MSKSKMIEAGPQEVDQAHNEKIKQLEAKFVQVSEELAKAENKVFSPIYAERSEFLKTVPGFWLQVLANFPSLGVYLHDVDHEPLSHLRDIEIQTSSADIRQHTLIFHFAENPFFNNTTISKTFTPKKDAPKFQHEYMMESHSDNEKVMIDWKSEEKNLGKTHPTVGKDPVQDPNFDPGSFFSVLFESGLDLAGSIASSLVDEVHPNAIEIYTGQYTDPAFEGDLPDLGDESHVHGADCSH